MGAIGTRFKMRDMEADILSEKGLLHHQIAAFNKFLHEDVQRVFDEVPEIEINPQQKSGASDDGEDIILLSSSLQLKFASLEKPDLINTEGRKFKLLPTEARLRSLTYSASLYVDIVLKMRLSCVEKEDEESTSCRDGKRKRRRWYGIITEPTTTVVEKEEVLRHVFIGKIPMMVKSDLCHFSGMKMKDRLRAGDCLLDSGGYFIINGSEKVLMPQEKIFPKMLCTPIKDKAGLEATYTLSSSQNQGYRRRTTAKLVFSSLKAKYHNGAPFLTVRFAGLKGEIPAITLLHALGVKNDKEVVERICENLDDTEMVNLVGPSLYQAHEDILGIDGHTHGSSTQRREKALQYLQNYVVEGSIEDMLDKTLFPHLENHNIQKVMLLCYMFNCILSCFLGRRKLDNKDELKNKRLEMAGGLICYKLKRLLHFGLRKDIEKRLEKVALKAEKLPQQLPFYIDGSIITNGLNSAFSSGNWLGKTGVVATLKRNNSLDTLSHLRQLQCPVPCVLQQGRIQYWNKYAKGRICPVETPDNENCGEKNSLCIGCQVSLGLPENAILGILKEACTQKTDDVPPSSMGKIAKVFLNEVWIAVHANCKDLVKYLRNLRRKSQIHPEVEIAHDLCYKEVRIFCDAGRFLRPLVVLEEVEPETLCKIKTVLQSQKADMLRRLLDLKVIELVGAEEEENLMVAEQFSDIECGIKDQYTHCELHPSYCLSLGTSLIPFLNHNPHTRVMMQSQKHGKQAIGITTTCPSSRADTAGHELFYPQSPLCKTRIGGFLKQQGLMNGQNAIVAISPFYGYNQEDSIVLNKSSVDRGLFRSMHFRSFHVSVDSMVHRLKKPSLESSNAIHATCVHKLDDDGLPRVGENLFPKDILVGKEYLQSSTSEWKESSIKLKVAEMGRVDRVILTGDEDENTIVHVKLREARSPVDGDKFSSRHGQKGVVGLLCHEVDMPFTHQGVVPDIIINPHAFPSRQTVGQLLEAVIAKITAINGRRYDKLPFIKTELQLLFEELKRCGHAEEKEMMINGKTGERLKERTSISPIFYQRLVHMAMDKFKCRSRGPVHPYTRQPVAGRKLQGGVKFGEMERDCLIAHGASANLRERLFLLSDPYTVYICASCNRVASKERHGFRCYSCKTRKHIVRVPMPYACKLLYQELLSMGVHLKFWTELS